MAQPPANPSDERLTNREIPDVELIRHYYNRRALWGAEAVLYRRSHPMEWKAVAGNYQNWAVDTTEIIPSDFTSAPGEPTRLFYSNDVEVSISRRRESMPYFFRNCDADGAGRGYTRVERNRPASPYDTGDTLSAYTLKPLKGTPEAFQHAQPIMC